MMVGYRAGPIDRKTEFQSQFTGGSRSTGYFGTGYYFCTRPEYCKGLDNGERPLYKLFFKDGLKWLFGDIKKHDSLKKLSAYVYNYNELKNIDDDLIYVANKATDLKFNEDSVFERIKDDYENWGESEGESWKEYSSYDTQIRIFMNALKGYSATIDFYNELMKDTPDWNKLIQMEKDNPQYFDYNWLKELRDLKFQVEGILTIRFGCNEEFVRNFAERHVGYHQENRYGENDSIMTVFLKELGYDGVWPEDECDNTTYGGVIFEKESIEHCELLSEKAKDYVKSYFRNERTLNRLFNSYKDYDASTISYYIMNLKNKDLTSTYTQEFIDKLNDYLNEIGVFVQDAPREDCDDYHYIKWVTPNIMNAALYTDGTIGVNIGADVVAEDFNYGSWEKEEFLKELSHVVAHEWTHRIQNEQYMRTDSIDPYTTKDMMDYLSSKDEISAHAIGGVVEAINRGYTPEKLLEKLQMSDNDIINELDATTDYYVYFDGEPEILKLKKEMVNYILNHYL